MSLALAPADPDRLSAEWRSRLAASGLTVTVRPMQADESTFVHETTCRVRWPWRSRGRGRTMGWQQWYDKFGPSIALLMQSYPPLVAESGGIVLGFALIAGGSVSMLYCKREFRGNGIGLMLLEHAGLEAPISVTEPMPTWIKWAERHELAWQRSDRR